MKVLRSPFGALDIQWELEFYWKVYNCVLRKALYCTTHRIEHQTSLKNTTSRIGKPFFLDNHFEMTSTLEKLDLLQIRRNEKL